MTLKLEMLGWAGTALVVIAYVPQIRHLYVEKCAWGISISTWLIWLVAGALLLSYCIIRNDTLFTIVQGINITAIVTTIVLARRGNQICPYHQRSALAPDNDRRSIPSQELTGLALPQKSVTGKRDSDLIHDDTNATRTTAPDGGGSLAPLI